MKLLCLALALLLCSRAEADLIDNLIGSISGSSRSYESPAYTVVQTFDEFEERVYQGGLKWVCTTNTRQDYLVDDDRSSMFMKMFRYISGDNEGQMKIDMTVPVSTEIRRLNQVDKSVELTMCFYLPSAHQASPPAPTDPDVFITTRSEMDVYTRRVGGYMNERKWMQEKKDLATLVEAEGLRVQEQPFYVNGYDSPMKFWNRRNEVWLVKA